jgi:hypothetical protein
MTTEKTESVRPPAPSDADLLLQELANVGVSPDGTAVNVPEENRIQSGPKTEIVSQGEATVISGEPQQSIMDGSMQDGLIDNFPGAAAMTILQDPGWIWVYDRFTGDPSVCNVNMLPAQLKKRQNDPDSEHYGKVVFTTTDPGFRPPEGTYKCWIHKEGPWFSVAKEWGLEPCGKSNLDSDFEAIQHTRNKHNRAFLAIQEHKNELERQEERSERKALLQAIANMQERAPVVQAEREVVVTSDHMTASEPPNMWREAGKAGHCPIEDCNFVTEAAKLTSRRSAIYRHRQQQHA